MQKNCREFFELCFLSISQAILDALWIRHDEINDLPRCEKIDDPGSASFPL